MQQVLGAKGTPYNAIKVGVNINWEKICGCPARLIFSTDYFGQISSNPSIVKNEVNVPDVQRLFRSVQWIGISAYAGLPQYLTLDDLQTSMRKVDQELGVYGLSLRGLGKEIILSEYGLGGGMSGDYKTPAESSANVAASPYWGVDGAYEASRDPWNRADNRAYMQRFYDLTVQFAKQGGGSQYPITGIFLWNIVSYDVLGVHYWSSGSSGSYRDGRVADAIRNYNNGLRG